MLYSDYFELVPGEGGRQVRRRHPLIDCQYGSLRDDFDFGPVLVFRTSSFREAVRNLPDGYKYGALYAVRLSMKNTVHVGEYLYTAVETDMRKSGEKQFDYVDPRNRDVQIEMEADMYLAPEADRGISFPVLEEGSPSAGEGCRGRR